VEFDFQLDELLWHLVNQHVRRQSRTKTHLNTEEDLFSEARIAAMVAITSYDLDKKTKLSTFVAECVTNRLRDIDRYERRRPSFDEIPEDLEGTGYDTIEDMEFNMTMRSVLNDREYLVYFKIFVEDRSIRDISVGENKIMSKGEASQCLRLILQKFRFLEKSQIRLLTRRTLQTKWLEDSPSLQLA
jgi:DNA-directed RNA polymerase specialized sigma subunit